MSTKVTKIEMVVTAFINGLAYNFIEVILLCVFLVGAAQGHIWEPLLYGSFAVAVAWIFLLCIREAEDEARLMVLHRELFITDFIFGAGVFVGIAVVLRGELWYFWAIFLAAAVQNLRYMFMATRWLLDEKKLKGDETDTTT